MTQSVEKNPKMSGLTTQIARQAVWDAFRKLNPVAMMRNPVMFVVEVGSVLTTILWVRGLMGSAEEPVWFIGAVSLWLWFTVIFANFAEAVAEGRGKAQALALRRARKDLPARLLEEPRRDSAQKQVPSTSLRKGDVVLVETGDTIPADGEVMDGIASVDESAITGESAPVVRESGGDRSAVTGGTKVLSDWIVVRVSAEPGSGFLDRMIKLIEGAPTSEDPKRGRPEYPAFCVYNHIPCRLYHASPILTL